MIGLNAWKQNTFLQQRNIGFWLVTILYLSPWFNKQHGHLARLAQRAAKPTAAGAHNSGKYSGNIWHLQQNYVGLARWVIDEHHSEAKKYMFSMTSKAKLWTLRTAGATVHYLTSVISGFDRGQSNLSKGRWEPEWQMIHFTLSSRCCYVSHPVVDLFWFLCSYNKCTFPQLCHKAFYCDKSINWSIWKLVM